MLRSISGCFENYFRRTIEEFLGKPRFASSEKQGRPVERGYMAVLYLTNARFPFSGIAHGGHSQIFDHWVSLMTIAIDLLCY